MAFDLHPDNERLGSSRIFEAIPHLTQRGILEGGIVNSALGALPAYMIQGQVSDVEIHANEMIRLKQKLNESFADHTGQTVDQIRIDTERDNFMSAAEAQEYGLIDKVVTNRVVKK